MTWISTQHNAYKTVEFRTERRAVQKIIAGDMVYLNGDFVEVVETRHTRRPTSEGEGALLTSNSHSTRPRTEVVITVTAKNDVTVFDAVAVGTWSIVLVDTTDEPKMLLRTHEEAETWKKNYEVLVQHLAIVGNEEWWEKNSGHMDDEQLESVAALAEAVKNWQED